MESWRKFLKEEPYDDDRNASNIIDLGDRDPTSWDPEREKLRAKMQKDNEMMKAAEGAVDESFPIINGRNFILPIEGKNKSGYAGWHQLRGDKKDGVQAVHAGIDVFVPAGTPIRAIADGRIIKSNESKYNGYVINMVNLLNKRIEQNELINDVNMAMGVVIKRYSKYADRKDHKGQRYRLRARQLKNLNEKYPDGRYTGRAPPTEWEDLINWGITDLTPKALDNLLRYYKKTQGLHFPTGGMGITLKTDPDQFGNVWRFYAGHCSKIIVASGPVKAGDTIALVGNTALFDKPGTNDHLHFSTVVHSDSGRKIANSPAIRMAANRSIDPRRVIPEYTGGVAGVYAGDAEDDSDNMRPPLTDLDFSK